MTSSRQTRQRQPLAYFREYVRIVRAPESLTPLEIGCVGLFDTQAGQFWPTCLYPLSADVNEGNRVQLAQRYELHAGWMKAKSYVLMPLARLPYPPGAFEKRSIDLRCRYVEIHASEERKLLSRGYVTKRGSES